jgi:hypothetical protein
VNQTGGLGDDLNKLTETTKVMENLKSQCNSLQRRRREAEAEVVEVEGSLGVSDRQ